MVGKEAATEAEVEREFEGNSSSLHDVADGLLGQSTLRHVGEEVFLAQLHRRARLLNDGFQNRIVKVLSRYEAVSRVRSKDSWSHSDISGLSTRLSANLVIKDSSMSHSFARRELIKDSSMSHSFARRESIKSSTISERSWYTADAAVVFIDCNFADGVGAVEVHQAPIKTWVDTSKIVFVLCCIFLFCTQLYPSLHLLQCCCRQSESNGCILVKRSCAAGLRG